MRLLRTSTRDAIQTATRSTQTSKQLELVTTQKGAKIETTRFSDVYGRGRPRTSALGEHFTVNTGPEESYMRLLHGMGGARPSSRVRR